MGITQTTLVYATGVEAKQPHKYYYNKQPNMARLPDTYIHTYIGGLMLRVLLTMYTQTERERERERDSLIAKTVQGD